MQDIQWLRARLLHIHVLTMRYHLQAVHGDHGGMHIVSRISNSVGDLLRQLVRRPGIYRHFDVDPPMLALQLIMQRLCHQLHNLHQLPDRHVLRGGHIIVRFQLRLSILRELEQPLHPLQFQLSHLFRLSNNVHIMLNRIPVQWVVCGLVSEHDLHPGNELCGLQHKLFHLHRLSLLLHSLFCQLLSRREHVRKLLLEWEDGDKRKVSVLHRTMRHMHGSH